MAECRQCGVHIMVPPEDERCPMCGCEDMYDYIQEEIDREFVRCLYNKCVVCGGPATWADPNSLNKIPWVYCDKHKKEG